MPVEDPIPQLKLQRQDDQESAPVAATASAPPLPSKAGSFDLWIEAGHTEKHYWIDIWRFRELLFILAWRDLAVRYKQSVAGVAWALIQPLISMLVMVVIYRKVAGMPTIAEAPYAIMIFAGLLPWNFFAGSMSKAGESLVGNANMISKIYFPRAIIPASSVLVSLADFVISLAILGGLMVWYEFAPTWRFWFLPLFTALTILASMGIGLFITALMLRFRDFRFIVPVVVQFGMWISVIPLTSAELREKIGDLWFFIYSLNPLVGIIEGFRWAILGNGAPLSFLNLFISLVVSALIFAGGVTFFRKTERHFADII